MNEILMHRDVAAATHGRLVVSSLAAKLTVPILDALMDAAAAHRAQYGSQGLSLTVMKPNIAVPDDQARAHIKALNVRPDGALVSVVVIDGAGFWAAAMRTVLASVALVNSRAPTGASTVKEALLRLAPHLPGEDLAALEADVIAFRMRHLGL